MAMNKAEKAMLEQAENDLKAADREVRLHQVTRILPLISPDVAAPGSDAPYGTVTSGWLFNSHSLTVYRAESSSIAHYTCFASDGKCSTRASGSQGSRHLYSTKALAREALRRKAMRELAIKLLDMETSDALD